MFMAQQPMLYPTDDSKMFPWCTSGKALDWATADWSNQGPHLSSFNELIQQLQEAFENPEGGKNLILSQTGKKTFCTHSAQMLWEDDT